MKKLTIGLSVCCAILSVSCNSFLDIVPDSIATIQDAFTTRNQAEKYLFTCYSYMPQHGQFGSDPAVSGSDEFCPTQGSGATGGSWRIVRGEQSAGAPILGSWNSLWEGVSTCNIFLENIHLVPGMEQSERDRWIAEVRFLKAYYHFYAIRMYGPVPIKDVNLPIDASPELVKVYRDPLDDCFDYVVRLLDEIIDSEDLPAQIEDRSKEMGRITQEIALALKAYVLVYAASPLFNGNSDYKGLVDNRDREIFCPDKTEAEKKARWEAAAEACRQAIDFSDGLGRKLYRMNEPLSVDDDTYAEVSLRSVVTEPWNTEVIWANSNELMTTSQVYSVPRGLSNYSVGTAYWRAILAVNQKMATLFYSDKGVPVNEDVTWNYSRRNEVVTIPESHDNLLIKGYKTAYLHLNREMRFYSALAFDGARWYAYNKTAESRAAVKPFDKPKHYAVRWRQDGHCFTVSSNSINETGYSAKKLVHYKSNLEAGAAQVSKYPYVLIRLADLYLLYAEALNESGAAQDDVLEWVDRVRARAGLRGVAESWSNYSSNPLKYTSLEGRREIIQRERTIELAFEGKRFWDLRRWKKLITEMNQPLLGWSHMESDPAFYYQEKVLYKPVFGVRDYFWPIDRGETLDNRNLVQNYGWQ